MSDLAQIKRADARGMITLRSDLAAPKIAKAIKAVSGQAMPKIGQMRGDGQGGVVWMSPDEVLVMVPYGQVDAAMDKLTRALEGLHHLVADVSDARAVFVITGAHARDVIGKLAPADISQGAFKVGAVRRTRLAQVPAAIYRPDASTFEVICFRSVAEYADGVLRRVAAGAAVGFHA